MRAIFFLFLGLIGFGDVASAKDFHVAAVPHFTAPVVLNVINVTTADYPVGQLV